MSIVRVDKVPYSAAGFGQTLTHDLAHGVPSALSFFPAQRWQDVVSRIDTHTYRRADVSDVLEKSAKRLNAPPAVLENIALLREPRTYVVATGQQAGLLGGPLYSLHKALTAIKLSRQFDNEAQGRAKFIPIFWVAGDDHDLAEIDHADLLDSDGNVARVKIEFDRNSMGRSACDVAIGGAALEALRGQLAGVLGDEVAQRFIKIYSNRSLAEAFAALLTEWLGPLGLVVVQSHEMRQFAGSVLLRDLNEYDVASRLIQESAVSLKKFGYEPGFSEQARVAPHFFIASEPHKIRAHLDPLADGKFQERSQAFAVQQLAPRIFTKQRLADWISSQPHLFSASAALRPLVQQHIFPVVAAVLGPGEIAYWAQLKSVHDHFGIVWPVVVPRATLTLIDAKGEKAMRKLGIEPGSPELFLGFEKLSNEKLGGGRVGGNLERRMKTIHAELEAMEAEVREADGGLKPLFDKAKERIAHELARVAEKTKASIDQKDGAGLNRLRYLSSLARPKNSPQERILCAGQFMSVHPALAQELFDAIDPSIREHLIVTFDEKGDSSLRSE